MSDEKPNIPPRRDEQFQAFANGIMEEEWPPIEHVFIDFDCFQDFNLGTLFAMINTEEEFQYILSRMQQYQNRLDNDTAKYFPALGFTEDQIRKVKQDPKNHEYISAAAPAYEFFYQFAYEAMDLVQKGRHPYHFEQPIQIHLLFKEVFPSETVRNKWWTWGNDLFEEADVHFLYGDIDDRGNEFYGDMNFIVVENIEKLINVPSVDNAMMNKLEYLEKEIRAPYMINRQLVNPEEQDVDDVLKRTEDILSLVSRFHFISRKLSEGGN